MPVRKSVVTLDGGTSQDHGWLTYLDDVAIPINTEILVTPALDAGQYKLQISSVADSGGLAILRFQHVDSTKAIIRNELMGAQIRSTMSIIIPIVDVQQGDFFRVIAGTAWIINMMVGISMYWLKLD